jgi:hypothetical protein
MKKNKIIFNKTIYICMNIPDISKIRMCDFYSNVMKNQLNDKVTLLYMDSDCLNVEIKTEDIFDDVKSTINGF